MKLKTGHFLAALLAIAALGAHANDSKALLSATVTKNPENQLRTSDGRTFVTAESGIYEVVNADNGKVLQKLTTVFRTAIKGKIPANNSSCYFLGLVQRGNSVITTCVVDLNTATTPRYLLTLDLADSSKTVREIAPLTNMGVSNGMAIDPQGRLYITDEGVLLNPGKIVRINFKAADPMQGFTQSTWVSRSGHPNGIKATNDAVYFTEGSTLYTSSGVYRAAVKADGSIGTITKLYGSNSVYDDLILVKGGIVFCDYSNRHIVHLDENGQVLHTSTSEFIKPSSLLLDSQQVAPWSTLWVTERDAGLYSSFSQDWGLQAR